MSEYKSGTTAKLYWQTTDEAITLQNLTTVERQLNEANIGMTNARYQQRLVPPGLHDPFEVKNVDELYKADYDEHWLKQMASFFNLMPSQLGVVARAGLGGGKGASEGAQDEAESVSSKPQNRQLEGVFNSLNRQHLGCDRNVVASLKNDEGSEDQLEQANAFKIFVESAIMTPNEAREEMGMTPATEPEADELAFVGATGPTFLTGLLAAQETAQEMASKPPPAPIINQIGPNGGEQTSTQPTSSDSGANGKDGDNGQTEGDQSNSQSKEGGSQSGSKKVALAIQSELEQFARFVPTQYKRKKWRNFEFDEIDSETADKLNNAAYSIIKGVSVLPDNFSSWAIETAGLAPLGKRAPHRAEAKLRAIANNHVGKISTALKLTGVAAAIAGAVNHAKDMDHLLDEGSALAIATTYGRQTGIDSKALQLRLVSLYQEVGKEAQDQFRQQTGQAVGSVDLQGLLAKANITISGIDSTAQDRVITAVKDGLLNGDSTSAIADAIQATVEGPMRLGQADLIARTETSRAYSEVFGDQLTQAGMATWEWVCEGGDPCQACLDQEGTKDITDTDYPPLHPNCACAVEAPSQ